MRQRRTGVDAHYEGLASGEIFPADATYFDLPNESPVAVTGGRSLGRPEPMDYDTLLADASVWAKRVVAEEAN